MEKKWFESLNFVLGALIAGLLLVSLIFFLLHKGELEIPVVEKKEEKLPTRAFALKPETYEAIGPPFLALKFSPMTLQLPDLRRQLVYYGKNERPDADLTHPLLFLGFSTSPDIVEVKEKEPTYLVYDKNQPVTKYSFSAENEKTALWLKAVSGNKEVAIELFMKDEAGKIIRQPESYSFFTLLEREYSRIGRSNWIVGQWRVDPTLLIRQRGRWYGEDLFLQRHGGEEYKEIAEKNRIDFGESEGSYFVFIAPGDTLAWKEDRWKVTKPGEETLGYPLLVVQKIEDRLIKFELWDEAGKGRIFLTLVKSFERGIPRDLKRSFKFVGARTRTQFAFEVDRKRMLISPQDWLLFQDGKWRKLQTPQEIDAYVEGKIRGSLFIFDGVQEEGGKVVLLGTVFSSTRSEMEKVELPIHQGAKTLLPHNDRKKSIEIKEDEDDDEDLDDEEDDEDDEDDE